MSTKNNFLLAKTTFCRRLQ